MKNYRSGISLVELVLVVLIIGILTAVAVPRMGMGVVVKHKVKTTAQKIATDLRRCRSLAIAEAASNSTGYSLNMTGSAPYSGYEIINLATGESVDSYTFRSDVTCTGADEFKFGPLGNLTESAGTVTVSGSGKTYTITVVQATGMVRCNESD